MGRSLSLQSVVQAQSRPASMWKTSEKLNTRKNGDFTVWRAHVFCINGTDVKPVQTGPWICCLETAAHVSVNSLQDCANVEHRSRSCLPRPRHHRSFDSPVPTSACEC